MSELKDVGLILKNKRIELGYSIADVQEYIKVKSYYIQAIEDGNEKKLPDPIYIKGFIKSYAEMLGLNSDIFLHDLHLTHDAAQNEIIYEDNKRFKFDIDYKKIFKKYSKYLFILIFVALIVYGIYSLGNFLGVNMKDKNNSFNANNVNTKSSTRVTKNQNNKPANKTNKTENNTKTQNKNNENEKINVTQLTKTTNTDSEYYYQVTSNSDTYKLKIDITGEKCWMEIDTDGQQVYSGTLLSGDSRTYDVKNNATIYLGKASDITISVDGQNTDKAASPGVFTYKFTK